MNHTWAQSIAIYPQYILFSFLMVVFIYKSFRTRIRRSDVLPYITMLMFSLVGYINGLSHGYDVNLKPFVLTFLIIFLNSRKLPIKFFKKIIFVITVLLIFEYLVAYTQIIPFEHLMRNYLIRPMGMLFLDTHILSYVVVFSYFALGYTKLSGFLAIFFGTFQSALAWLVLAYSKLNKVLFLFAMIVIVTILAFIGHLSLDLHEGMLSVIIRALSTPVDYDCLAFGCSANFQLILKESDEITDFGIYRILYQFGLIWILCFLYILRRYKTSFVLANTMLWLHYPVNLGVLGIVFFVWILQYIEYIESRPLHKDNKATLRYHDG